MWHERNKLNKLGLYRLGGKEGWWWKTSNCSFELHKWESLRKVIQILLRDKGQEGMVPSCSKANSYVFKGKRITGQLI